jgi:prepilin-type N-terminal cleavage/methylation domain-containing protein
MLQKLNSKRGGFTLVEIMIVVAIIALLAAIAVPNFLRARKRSQATGILEEMRLIDGAKDQYAIERNASGTATVTGQHIAPYVKNGTRLYTALAAATGATVADSIGGTITINAIDVPPVIADSTRDNFSDVVPINASFWGSYSN